MMVRVHRIPMWIWFCILLPVQGIEYDISCYDNCSCCKNKKCHSADLGAGTWTNVCTQGCIDRHRAARCYQLCEYNCVSCDDIVRICTSCFDGFHLGRNNDCTAECPTGCKICISDTKCTACKQGYFNEDSSTTCPYTLCPGNCKCSDNTCTSCKHGFFDTGNECNQECPSNCVTCLSRDMCNECKHGFYNGYEFDNNARQLSNTCTYKCRARCTECQSYDKCLHCVNGKYGPKCKSSCSYGCIDKTCHIESGNCICLLNFEGDRCTYCVTGKYGTYCNEVCPEHCKDDRCNRTTGHCSKGCITSTIIGSSCNICTVGMHGTFCNKSCPTNCKAKACNRTTGVCSEGCKYNFKGSYCDTCIEQKYGVACDQACPLKCENSLCEKESGNCFNCTGNFYGDTCENCKPGFHGSNCNEKCSTYCENTTCVMHTGNCDNGCTYNYSGDMCCVPGLHCVKCASKTECIECDNGFYGSTCNNKCSNLCIDNICKQDSGICDKGCDGSNDDRVCVLSKQEVSSDDDLTTRTTNIVLGTLLALTTTALFVFILMIMLRKLRWSDRQARDSSLQVHSLAVTQDPQSEVSEAANSAYEILERTHNAPEHTYDTASTSPLKSMGNHDNTDYINLNISKT